MSDNLKILQAMVLLANTLKYSSTYKESLIRDYCTSKKCFLNKLTYGCQLHKFNGYIPCEKKGGSNES